MVPNLSHSLLYFNTIIHFGTQLATFEKNIKVYYILYIIVYTYSIFPNNRELKVVKCTAYYPLMFIYTKNSKRLYTENTVSPTLYSKYIIYSKICYLNCIV